MKTITTPVGDISVHFFRHPKPEGGHRPRAVWGGESDRWAALTVEGVAVEATGAADLLDPTARAPRRWQGRASVRDPAHERFRPPISLAVEGALDGALAPDGPDLEGLDREGEWEEEERLRDLATAFEVKARKIREALPG